jgi:tetratricopeptide (TPR) repeat protein
VFERRVSQPTIILNSAWLRNRVAELGLKQWWLAEQVGVDKKTVIRWMHGHVRAIQTSNAQALASVLGCRTADLELPRDAVDLATADDQRAAAALLANSALLDKLGPVGEWDVIESLLKAVAVADLPLHVLGTLYNRLCIACWRQSKIEQAEAYNLAAFDAARRCGDQALLAGAHASCANLLHWRGACAQAQAHYRAGLELARFIEPAAVGGLHCNLGASLYETGDVDAGELELREALALYRFGGSAMQISIVHCHLAILALRRGDWPAARVHTEASESHALQADYRRGLAMGAMLHADIDARLGNAVAAETALQRGLSMFGALGIAEGPNCEIEGRVMRLSQRPADARRALGEGLRLAAAFPLERGRLHVELALTEQGDGEAERAQASARQAIKLFLVCEAPLLAQAVADAFGLPAAADG